MPIAADLFELESGDELLLESGSQVLLESITITFPATAPQSTWTLQLCRDGDTIAVCSAYEFSAVTERNRGGAWMLDTSEAGVPPTGYPDPLGSGNNVPFDPRDVTDVRLIINGRIAYAGDVHTDMASTGGGGGFYAERNEGGERWRWTGIERGWHALQSRLAYPDPATEPPWSVTHDVRTGLASSVLAGYINANAGGSALADRAFPGLDVVDEQVGLSYTFSARLTTLADLASRISKDGDFLVVPEHDFDGSISYRLTLARDLSGVIVFSDRGDLLKESHARFLSTEATYVITGGTGEGTSRTFRTATTGATGHERKEVFSDQRNMSSSSEVQADADARLKIAGEQFEVTTTLSDSIAVTALDFGLRAGDKLGIVVRGRRYSLPIEAIQLSVTPERQTLRPRFGAARPNELVELLDSLDHLSDRFDQQIA